MREYKNRFFDSSAWEQLKFRDDDIIITTYAKAGTTWVQQIVAQLIFDGRADIDVASISPFLEEGHYTPIPEKLALYEAQTHRRFIKSHLPADTAVYGKTGRYIYVARDGRDVAWSLYSHQANRSDEWFSIVNQTEEGVPLVRPPITRRDYFVRWVKEDGAPLWPFWENIRSWWAVRNEPNVMFLHYNQLKADLPGCIRKIAKFIEAPIVDAIWPTILEHCSFEFMRSNAKNFAPGGPRMWKGGAETFFSRGTNGGWREELTEDDCRLYEVTAREQLGDACFHWLTTGELPASEQGV